MFSRLCKIFSGLTIDLFAIFDAFNISWKVEKFYSFPLFSFIPGCLEKVVCAQAEGVLMVPAWSTQTWYTRIVQMLISQPVVMVWMKETSLLIHPSGPRTQNMQGHLKLMACQVSEDTTKYRAFLNTLLTYLSTNEHLPLRNSAQFILGNGLYSVVQGKLLYFPQI